MNRRSFLGSTAATLAAIACGDDSTAPIKSDPRLTVAPSAPTGSVQIGDMAIGIDAPRDGRLYVPPGYSPSTPAPLMLGLHGAGGSGANWISAMKPAADLRGVVMLAPDSRDVTWDAIGGVFNEDVKYINSALAKVFSIVNIDASRIAIAGFSDGASYSLSLGIANGDLFPYIIAFSPGFILDAAPHGHPKFFIEHGTADTILPINACSRVIVPNLKGAGYDVTYTEFDGGHVVTTTERDDAFAWFAA